MVYKSVNVRNYALKNELGKWFHYIYTLQI